MDDIVLNVKGVHKKYSNGVALSDINIALKKGHIYALAGDRGSGKTTLFRILTGLCKQTSGEIEMLGMSGRGLTKARKQVGALVDNPAFCSHLNIRQNLKAQSMTLGRVDKARIDKLLGAMKLTRDVTGSRKISGSPTGMKQSYSIVLALLGRPALLLLDEVFSGLDSESSQLFISLIKAEMAERDMTVLLSGQRLSELYSIATDFIFLSHGRILLTLSRDELIGRMQEEPDDKALNEFYESLAMEAEK